MTPKVSAILLLLVAVRCSVYAAPVLQGYDVVEYHSLAARGEKLGKLGSSNWACRLLTFDLSEGLKKPIGVWELWFSSPRNVKLFKRNPWRYLPKYGGFSSSSIARDREGFPWDKDFQGPPAHPWDSWKVHEEQLYMDFLSPDLFFEAAEENIALADARWISWYGSLKAGPFNTHCQSGICHSLPQTRQNLTGLPLDTPEVWCTTSGFVHPLSRIIIQVGKSQQEIYRLHKHGEENGARSSLTGGSADGGTAQGQTEIPIRVLGTFLGSSTGASAAPAVVDEDDDADDEEGTSQAVISPEIIGEEVAALKEPFSATSFIPPALLGYDMVAYFDIEGPKEGITGNPKYACHLATFDKSEEKKSLVGVYEFWFRNEENMEKFRAQPWQYVPRYGGFCSWGTATELKQQGWPWEKTYLGPPAQPWDGWSLFGGHLYLNYWPSIAGSFFANPEQNINRANERWEDWWGALEAGPINTHCPNAVCLELAQDLSPPCPQDAQCKGDIPEISCLVRETVPV